MCFSVTIRTPSFQEYPLNTDAAGTAPPDAFGPFRVLHQIGAGALGPVFRAYQPEQDRLVAVKLFRVEIPPERSHQLVAQLERLIAADLTHAGLAAPLAAGLSDVSAFLAMDFVAADSLDMVIRDHSLSAPADAVRVASQLASALDLAAAVDITHGALHPRDVLLSADDVRMTGIGIARALEAVGAAAPIRRPYTAPERAAGGAWDRRADVFSLAALVFELLTRRRISGPGDQPLESYAGIAGVSADALDKVFDRALAERPADRFASAGDFAKALQAAIEKKRSVSSRLGPNVRPTVPVPVEPPPPAPGAESEGLPLFTESLLGIEPEPADAAADATPPPIADADHEALADLSFRDAPLSMVESLHEPDPVSDSRGRISDDGHQTPLDAPGHKLSLDDFTEAVHDSPKSSPLHAFSADAHAAGASADLSLTHREPDFDIEEVFARDGAEPPTRPGPFESIETSSRGSSTVWPLMLALVVGIALGFGMAMLLLGRDRVPTAPQQAAASSATGRPATEVKDEPVREVTEQTVPSGPKPATPAPPPSTADVPGPVANTPVGPPPRAVANERAAASKPSVPAASASAARGDTRVPKAPARPPSRAPVAASKAPTSSPKMAASAPKTAAAARPASGARGSASTVPGRNANRSAGAAPVKPAAQNPPKAPSGSLAVESRPAGASVYIDGRRVGTTPFVLETLKAGQYTIGLDLDGYKRWATTVRVTADERSRVAASLER